MRGTYRNQSYEGNKPEQNEDLSCERAHVLMPWFVTPERGIARVAERDIQGYAHNTIVCLEQILQVT